MKAVKVDTNRNPILKNGSFQFVYDVDVISQNCDQAMRQQLGELNYDKDKGIEYFDNVYSGSPNFQRFEAQARAQILNVEGVVGINSFEYELSNESDEIILNYSANISTIYGLATVDDSFFDEVDAVTENQITLAIIAAQRWINAGANYASRFEV